MSDDDESLPPTADELREAAALAAALDRSHGAPELPVDAFAAAGVVRYARDGGALEDAAAERILDDVLAAVPGPAPAAERPWWKRPWVLLLPTGVGIAAAGAAILLTLRPGVPGGDLPRPSVALLRAQAEAASGGSSDALDAELTRYRATLHASLEERYRP
ncbi:MAG: hypothetical protein AAGH15_26140 [Myxococcota bacterium]